MGINCRHITVVGLAALFALPIAAQSLSPVKTETYPGGVIVQTLSNGNKVKFFPYGKVAFGNATVIFPNGSTIKGTYSVLPTGERRANFPDVNELDILPEGTTISHLSNGYIAEFFPNGEVTLILPGGTITVQSKNLPNGNKMLMLPGGNELEIDPGGKTTLILTSGEKVEGIFNVGLDGSASATLPTGSKIEWFPNGVEDVTLSNGYHIVKSLDGTVSMNLGEQGIGSFTLSPGLSSASALGREVVIFNIPSSWIIKDGTVSNHLVIVCGCRFMDFQIRAFVPYDGKNGDGLPQIEGAFLPHEAVKFLSTQGTEIGTTQTPERLRWNIPDTFPQGFEPGITQSGTAVPGSALTALLDKSCKKPLIAPTPQPAIAPAPVASQQETSGSLSASQIAKVTSGQTPDQVVAILGPPVSIAPGPVTVYSYPYLAISFVRGKVWKIHQFQ